jgi:hypothetical protein
MLTPRRLALTALIFATLASLGGAALAHPTPRPRPPAPVWLELGQRPIAYRPGARPEFDTRLLIRTDGTWERGADRGKLDPASKREVQRALAKAKLQLDRQPRVVCEAMPTRVERMKTTRGTVTWESPCGKPLEPKTEALLYTIAQVMERAVPDAPPPLAERAPLFSMSDRSYDGLDGSRIVIMNDGTWTRTGDIMRGPKGPASGVLSPDVLRSFANEVAATQLGRSSRIPPACGARLMWERQVELAGKGTFSWTGPCGSGPNEGLAQLITRAQTLTRTP